MLASLVLALTAATAHGQACGDLSTVPETTQVAWVSRRSRRVPGRQVVEVVRVQDLRAWVRANGADEARLVQGLGMAPRKGGWASKRPYKVTIFDVRTDWLCRPLAEGTVGEDVLGVATCEERDARPVRHHKQGYTGCGYTLDTAASSRGLDIYRVRWSDASGWGFCVMPLDRFISGA